MHKVCKVAGQAEDTKERIAWEKLRIAMRAFSAMVLSGNRKVRTEEERTRAGRKTVRTGKKSFEYEVRYSERRNTVS